MADYWRRVLKYSIWCTRCLCQSPPIQRIMNTTQKTIFTNVFILRNTETFIWRKLVERYKGSKPVLATQRFLIGACMFSWAHDKITDDEFNRTLESFHVSGGVNDTQLADPPSTEARRQSTDILRQSTDMLRQSSDFLKQSTDIPGVSHPKHPKGLREDHMTPAAFVSPEWEQVIDKPEFKLWRKPKPDSTLYEYRLCGSFHDISPRSFFEVQLNLAYRRQWDSLVVRLEVLDNDDETDTEVVHWVTHYPYPMCHREYVYVRRWEVDEESKQMLIVSKALSGHPSADDAPGLKGPLVRVTDYASNMLIQAHGDFEQNGFDYFLTYYDDPKSSIPRVAYSWMASSGIPDFVQKLHNAAKDLEDSGWVADTDVIYS